MAVSGTGIVLALLSAACFAVVYQCGWGTAAWAGVLAGAGWTVSLAAGRTAFLPDLVGAAVVGLGGEVLAVWRRQPVTLLVVPAIIPFVPGFTAYQSMVAFIDHRFQSGLEALVSALVTAAAIALGLAASSAVARPLIRAGARRTSEPPPPFVSGRG
jgi:uncharacterized membrane protein YjjB (DUF3815 family)